MNPHKGLVGTRTLLLAGSLCGIVMLAAAMVACGRSSSSVLAASETFAPLVLDAGLTLAPEPSRATAGQTGDTDVVPEEDTVPALDQAITDQVSADIAAIAEASRMQVGVSVIDLPTGARMEYQADEPTVSASMIKLIIAAAFLDEVKAGTASLDATYTLQASDMVGGTGSLNALGVGAEVSYREILRRMIAASDNTGTNIIIRAIGMDTVNAEAKKLGLGSTQLNRLMMDYDAIDAGIENYTSANDVAVLLEMAYEGTFVDAESSKLVLEALEQQEDWGGIKDGLPAGIVFAHKTGTLSQARHDGGIVEGKHPFVLVVLCSGNGFYEQGALDTMGKLAAKTYASLTSTD